MIVDICYVLRLNEWSMKKKVKEDTNHIPGRVEAYSKTIIRLVLGLPVMNIAHFLQASKSEL